MKALTSLASTSRGWWLESAPRLLPIVAAVVILASPAAAKPRSIHLKDLDCSTDQIAKWNGKDWVCAEDSDLLGGLSCALDDVAKWDGSEWVCAPDLDSSQPTKLRMEGPFELRQSGGNLLVATSSVFRLGDGDGSRYELCVGRESECNSGGSGAVDFGASVDGVRYATELTYDAPTKTVSQTMRALGGGTVHGASVFDDRAGAPVDLIEILVLGGNANGQGFSGAIGLRISDEDCDKGGTSIPLVGGTAFNDGDHTKWHHYVFIPGDGLTHFSLCGEFELSTDGDDHTVLNEQHIQVIMFRLSR